MSPLKPAINSRQSDLEKQVYGPARLVAHLHRDCPLCGAPEGELCIAFNRNRPSASQTIARAHLERLQGASRQELARWVEEGASEAPAAPQTAEERLQAALAELKLVQRKCYRKKQEIARLRAAADAGENAILRDEIHNYRKALGQILHLLDADELDWETTRSIAEQALGLKLMRAAKRRRVQRRYAREGEPDAAQD